MNKRQMMNKRRTKKYRGGDDNTELAKAITSTGDAAQQQKQLNDAIENVALISDINFFYSTNISTAKNTDPSYKEVGIFHMSSIAGLNALRSFGTNLANFFGFDGFEDSVIDTLREKLLKNIEEHLKTKPNIKICNLVFDLEAPNKEQAAWFMHGTGTIYQKK